MKVKFPFIGKNGGLVLPQPLIDGRGKLGNVPIITRILVFCVIQSKFNGRRVSASRPNSYLTRAFTGAC